MLWFSPSLRQSLFNTQTKHIFLPLSKAAKSALGILATGRQQGDQGLCTQHLQGSNERHMWKAVTSFKAQTLHLSSLAAAHKGQSQDASDSKVQERKSRDVTRIFFWALFMAYNIVSLLWKITWLLLLLCKARSKGKCLHSVGDNSAERGLCPASVTPEHQHKQQSGSASQPSTPAELTSFPHRLMLKKWKNLVPREVKLGPLINEPTWLRLLKL